MIAPPVVHPLQRFLDDHRPRLNNLAQAWLMAGAEAFGIYTADGWLAAWPAVPFGQAQGLRAPFQVSGKRAELWVFGLFDAASQARLEVDADLVQQLTSLNTDLDSMTVELIETQDQLLALYGLTDSMRNQLRVDKALAALLSESMGLMRAASASVFLNDTPPIVVQYPVPLVAETMLSRLLEQVTASGNHVIIVPSDAPSYGLPLQKFSLVEPIYVHNQVTGILCISKEGAFNSPDIKLLRAVCDQAGAHLENLLLYQNSLAQARIQTEMELAKTVQLNLLPQQLPLVAGLDVSAATLPASQVGGDFYDYTSDPGLPFLFTVGDVTGKGIPAAMLMAMTRTMIRSKTRMLEQASPADIIGALNDEMYDDFTVIGMFATVFIGQYLHEDHILYYANAGHSPVIFCPAGGTAVLLEADGTPIGVLPTCLCENQAIYFNQGDLLIAGTDGFSEATNPQGELFGYERLLQLVESVAYQSAAEIVQTLYRAIAEFGAGSAQDDDQTVVVIKGV